MSEKRFTMKYSFEDEEYVFYEEGIPLTPSQTVNNLNEQQATISSLKEENDILKQKLRKNYIANKQYEEMKRLQEENKQLKQEIIVYKKAFQEQVQRCTL